ncbi:hypothetical protein GGF37_004398 [Kickxella alabastrina]|nr:hypothetical protein GGF37_004398 [Kickxella alabastrina]
MHKPIALIPCISAVFLCACSLVSAHIELKEPPPRHSQFSKFYMDNDEIDYSMKSPLGPIVGYPCRNFKAGPTQGTMIAGHPFRVKFDGIATHLGGDCQFAVSYDNGTNFAVIWDKIANCFLDTVDGGYEIPVPDYIPASKKAIFAWTWINSLGLREYYMNCADVRIENYGHQQPLTAHELLVVNLPGKQTLTPRTGREEDKLPLMLKQRSFITVGKPVDLISEDQVDDRSPKAAAKSNSGSGSADDSDADGSPQQAEADPVARNHKDVVEDDESTLPDEITSYVYITRTITEDDDDIGNFGNNPDGDYSYSEIDNYRSRIKGSNGLTVLSEENKINEYLGSYKKKSNAGSTAAHLDVNNMQPLATHFTPMSECSESYMKSYLDSSIPFDVDDTMPLATHAMSINDNFDVWPSNSVSTLAAIDIVIGSSTAATASPVDFGMPPVSVEVVLFPGGSRASASVCTAPKAVTQFKTVTINNTPFLQVVVSFSDTAIPSSLTIAY